MAHGRPPRRCSLALALIGAAPVLFVARPSRAQHYQYGPLMDYSDPKDRKFEDDNTCGFFGYSNPDPDDIIAGKTKSQTKKESVHHWDSDLNDPIPNGYRFQPSSRVCIKHLDGNPVVFKNNYFSRVLTRTAVKPFTPDLDVMGNDPLYAIEYYDNGGELGVADGDPNAMGPYHEAVGTPDLAPGYGDPPNRKEDQEVVNACALVNNVSPILRVIPLQKVPNTFPQEWTQDATTACNKFRGDTVVIFDQGICQSNQGDFLETTDSMLMESLVRLFKSPYKPPFTVWPTLANIAYFQLTSNRNNTSCGPLACIQECRHGDIQANGVGVRCTPDESSGVYLTKHNLQLAYTAGINNVYIFTHSNGVVTAHHGYMEFMNELTDHPDTAPRRDPSLPPMNITFVHLQPANGLANETLIPLGAPPHWAKPGTPDYNIEGSRYLSDVALSSAHIGKLRFFFYFNRPDVATYGLGGHWVNGGAVGSHTWTLGQSWGGVWGPVGRFWTWEWVDNLQRIAANKRIYYGEDSTYFYGKVVSERNQPWKRIQDTDRLWNVMRVIAKKKRAIKLSVGLAPRFVMEPTTIRGGSWGKWRLGDVAAQIIVCREDSVECDAFGRVGAILAVDKGINHNQMKLTRAMADTPNQLWKLEDGSDDLNATFHYSKFAPRANGRPQ